MLCSDARRPDAGVVAKPTGESGGQDEPGPGLSPLTLPGQGLQVGWHLVTTVRGK